MREARVARLLLVARPMIVSALVLTTRGSSEKLKGELGSDERWMVGQPERGFLPVVVTAPSLGASRKIYEELSRWSGVDDVQLVSWVDEDVIPPSEGTDDAWASKEQS